MIKPVRKVYTFYVFVDIVIFFLSFYIPYVLVYNNVRDLSAGIKFPYLLEYNFIFLLWSFLLVVLLKRKNLYCTDRSVTIPKEIKRVIVSIAYTGILIGAIIFFSKFKFFSRGVFLGSFFMFAMVLLGYISKE